MEKPEEFEISPTRDTSLDSLREREELEEEEKLELPNAAEITEEEARYAKKWETFRFYGESARTFLDVADKCFKAFYAEHKGHEEQEPALERYDQLMSEVRMAIAMFVEDFKKAEEEGREKEELILKTSC